MFSTRARKRKTSLPRPISVSRADLLENDGVAGDPRALRPLAGLFFSLLRFSSSHSPASDYEKLIRKKEELAKVAPFGAGGPCCSSSARAAARGAPARRRGSPPRAAPPG